MLGILGIVFGVLLFVFMAYKGINIVISALAASSIMILCSQLPLYDTIAGVYMAGFAGFLKAYFLLFALSAILGRLMADGGGAKKIAVTLAKVVENSSDANKKFLCVLLVPVLYFILSYVGISGFVLVFTIMPIAKNLFEQTDAPWRLYCFGGPQAISATMLIGSLQSGNIYAGDACGTTTTAGVGLSIVSVVVWWIVTIILIKIFLKSAEKTGENFMTDGAAIKSAPDKGAGMADSELPSLPLALFPLVLVIVLSAAFQVPVVPALFISCVAAVIVFYKNLKEQLKNSLTAGLTGCYGAVFTVAATYAIGTVINGLPAFATFTTALNNLPGLAAGAGLGMVSALIMASVSSPIPVFGAQMLESYLSAGLSAGAAHRLMTITGWTCMAPHNAGISNAVAVTKIGYTRCLKIYMIATMVPGAIAMIVCLALAACGIMV